MRLLPTGLLVHLIGAWLVLWCFMPARLHGQSVLIPEGSVWLYSDVGPLTGTAWRGRAFDDTGWNFGPAPLGYGDDDEATVVGYGPNAASKHITTYFRHHFTVDDPAAIPEMKLDVLRDDGAVVFLNGTEVFRTNMTSGSISATTAANGANGADETSQFYSQIISAALLEPGDNVLAVEIHQDSAGSSDISFDLRLSLAPPALVAKGSVWRYLDNGADPGATWRDATFDDTLWLEGRAQLGYGDSDEETVVGFVDTDPVTAGDQKNFTTYFRHTFNVADPASIEALRLEILRDDGVVAWLNGTEVARSNMPAGEILFTTPASTTATNAEEVSSFITRTPSPSLLVAGENILAVEIHQESATSADISFDLRLSDVTPALTRGPYLNRCSDSQVTVRWRTDFPTDTIVRWGTAEGVLDQVFIDPSRVTEHVVRLTGLAAETRYYYSLERTGVVLAQGTEFYFVTHPPPGSVRPFRFWALGDSGTGNSNAVNVRNAFTTWNGSAHTDLLLLLGDNAYNSGLDSEYQANYFNIYPQTLRNTVAWPTLGNHEARSADSPTEAGPYYDIFSMPSAGECGGLASGVRAYYSFDYANVHFICLDSHDTPRLSTGAMAQWLIADLDATSQEWIIAFWHHPPYTKGTHDSDSLSDSSGRMTQMREIILPILESRGVDLVLNGHSHTYERSMLLDGHYGFSDTFDPEQHVVQPGDGDPAGNGAYIKVSGPNRGAVYTVTGSAGQAGNSFGLDHPVMVKALAQLGSLAVDVSGKRMDVRFIHASGEVRDSFRVVHQVPPVAQNSSVSTTEDTPAIVHLEASDENGDALSAIVITPPAHGTLTGTFPDLTFTPAADWNGADSFTWKANDGFADSSEVTVTLTVLPAPDAPVAVPRSVLTPPDTQVTFSLTGTDADGDALTFSIVTPPASGNLSGTPPLLTYSPAAGITGIVTFTFRVSDGTLESDPATVTLIIDDPPQVPPRTLELNEDFSAGITLTGTDANGHSLTFSIVTPPAHGTLSGTPPEVTYTPEANYSGPDSFTYRAFDGLAYSAPATVSITVLPVNDAPVALTQAISASPALHFTLTGTDADGDPLTYSIVTPPPSGTLSGEAPEMTFTPSPQFLGSVEFTFKVSDGTVNSPPATVTLTVENAAPGVPPRTLETSEDTQGSIMLTGTDANAHPLTFTVLTLPTRGILTGTAPDLTYTPNANFHGADSFTYRANDGLADSEPATVSITVLPVNDAPVAQPLTVTSGPPLAFTLTGTDADGDSLTYSIVTPPPSGTLSGDAPALTYSPAPQFVGSVEFTFKVSDGTVDSPPATVTLTVENAAPAVPSRTLETNEDTATGITLTGTDANQHPLTFTLLTLPTHGILSGTAPDLTYTPNANFHGADSFTYRANDGLTHSEPAAVTISVLPVNDVTVAQPLNAVTDFNTAVTFALAATDADTGDVLSYTVTGLPSHGSLSGIAPDLTYTPGPDFYGTDFLTFTAGDGTADSLPAYVSLRVLPPAPADLQFIPASGAADLAIRFSAVAGTRYRIDSSSDLAAWGPALPAPLEAPADGPLEAILPGAAETRRIYIRVVPVP